MNTLSWFLYLADALHNVKVVLILAIVAYVFLTIGIIIIKSMGIDFTYDSTEKKMKIDSLKEFINSYVGIKQSIAIIFVALMAASIPSQRTIYLIAASEFGQNVVESKVGEDLYQKINRYLEIQLGDLETKKSQ